MSDPATPGEKRTAADLMRLAERCYLNDAEFHAKVNLAVHAALAEAESENRSFRRSRLGQSIANRAAMMAMALAGQMPAPTDQSIHALSTIREMAAGDFASGGTFGTLVSIEGIARHALREAERPSDTGRSRTSTEVEIG